MGLILFSLTKILSPLKTVENGLNFFFRYLKSDENEIKKININTNDEFGNMAKVINTEMQIISEGIDQDKELINNVKEVVSEVNKGKLDIKVENSQGVTLLQRNSLVSKNELKGLSAFISPPHLSQFFGIRHYLVNKWTLVRGPNAYFDTGTFCIAGKCANTGPRRPFSN